MTSTHTGHEAMGSMHAQISMPYTLTAGHAMGTFLAELANRRILGSRCASCETVRVPAQDFCGDCGAETGELVQVPTSGVLEAWTVTDQGTVALVRLDGTAVPFLHHVVVDDPSTLSAGMQVEAAWVDEPSGNVLDLVGFVPSSGTAEGGVQVAGATAAPIEQLAYHMKLDYEHAYGHYYGTLFDGIKNSRRIRGVRCPSCRSVLVPPRPVCEKCYVRTVDWIDVPDTGVVKACSIVHVEFVGQLFPPPYVYAEIVLDGTATRLIHTVGGISAEDARTGAIKPGSRVKAVWSDRRTGSLTDIEYFAPVDADE